MKKKVVVGVVTLSLLLGTTAAYAAYDKHSKETQRIEHYEQVEKLVWNLYDNDLQTIVDGITLENIDQVKKQVMEIESEDQRKPLLKVVDEAQIIFNAKELMANSIIDGLYVENITTDQVINMKSAIEKIKPFNENLYNTFKLDMDYAAEQYSYLSSARLDLEKLKEKPNRTLYKEVTEQINKLNAIQKVKLTNELDEIDQILIAQENEEKRIAEEKAEKESLIQKQVKKTSKHVDNQTQSITTNNTVSNNTNTQSVSEKSNVTSTKQQQQSKSITQKSNPPSNNNNEKKSAQKKPETEPAPKQEKSKQQNPPSEPKKQQDKTPTSKPEKDHHVGSQCLGESCSYTDETWILGGNNFDEVFKNDSWDK